MVQMTIAAARVNAGYKQGAAARLIGVSQQTLRNWEKGKTIPNQMHIEAMCKLYGVTYDVLFFANKIS